MRQVILAVAMSLVAVPSFAVTSLRATVNGMVCPFCAQGIEKRIAKMDATQAVFVDLKSKVVAVEAKEGAKLDQAAIAAEIKDAGYDVVKMESDTRTVADIKASMKAKKK